MTNTVVLIGANSDVGGEVATRLLDHGHTVIATARNQDQRALINAKMPGLSDIFPLDLGNAETVFQILGERLGAAQVDGVIVCAAAGAHGPLETASLAGVRAVLETNALACLAIYQACLPTLRRRRGRMILIGSSSGKIALPFLGAYQASKFALEALADVMRQEGSMSGVTVVLVEPGGINTKMVRRMLDAVKQEYRDLHQPAHRLYGDLYKSFIALSENADWSQMSTAAQVADTVITAYQCADPEPRYVVGADAKYLLAERKVRNDREMDALAMEIYGVKSLGNGPLNFDNIE